MKSIRPTSYLTRADRRILDRLHIETFGTKGAGSFAEQLSRLVSRRRAAAIFSFVDRKLLHPHVVTSAYKNGAGLFGVSSYVTDQRHPKNFWPDYLDFLNSHGASYYELAEQIFAVDNEMTSEVENEILQHPYWDKRLDDLKLALGLLPAEIYIAGKIAERIGLTEGKPAAAVQFKALTAEKVTELVAECRQTGTIDPLEIALKALGGRAEHLVSDAVVDVNTAYKDLQQTFWEVREFINAVSPGTYPHPVVKSEPVHPLSPQGLKLIFDELRGVTKKTEDARTPDLFGQYKSSMSKTRSNIDKITDAINSLYGVNRLGKEHMDIMEASETAIGEYLKTPEGQALETEDSMMHSLLQAAKERLHRSSLALKMMHMFSADFGNQAIPMRETLSSTMDSINMTMVLQTSNVIIEEGNYKDNFYRSIERMADINSLVGTRLVISASRFSDTGSTIAADLVASANNMNLVLKDHRGRLKETRDPTTPYLLITGEDGPP